MLINGNSVTGFPDARDRFGARILQLTSSSSSLEEVIFLELSRGLLGSKGSFATRSGFAAFKANRGLSKLKKEEVFHTAETNELEISSGSSYSRWRYRSPSGEHLLRFANYNGRKFTIEAEYIEKASTHLWEVLGKTLQNSVLTGMGTGDPDYHRTQIKTALENFVHADAIAVDPLSTSGGDPYRYWTGIQSAMGELVAGAAVSSHGKTTEFVSLFLFLNTVWTGILERLLQELELYGNRMKSSEKTVNMVSDMFQRLSAIWYLRTIFLLAFGKKHIPEEERPPWKASLVLPRALDMAGRQIPELSPFPKMDKMREEVEVHR